MSGPGAADQERPEYIAKALKECSRWRAESYESAERIESRATYDSVMQAITAIECLAAAVRALADHAEAQPTEPPTPGAASGSAAGSGGTALDYMRGARDGQRIALEYAIDKARVGYERRRDDPSGQGWLDAANMLQGLLDRVRPS